MKWTKLFTILSLASVVWAGSPREMVINGQRVLLKEWNPNSATSIWQAGTREINDLRNGNYALVCQTSEGSYAPNMEDYVYSPPIDLPAGSVVIGDFYVRGGFSDPDQFPDVDYWGCQVSPDGGISWYYVSNPYGDPNGTNYVYSDAPNDWSSFNASYSTPIDISNYAGQTVQFRWWFHSDEDTPIGEGLFIDDFSLTVDGVTVYFEDFESGTMDGWTTEDATATPAMWHRTTQGAFGGTGHSWAMNDSTLGTNGGYLDHWYQTLDSPPVTLPATGQNTITFVQNRNIEAPGSNPPYDGWDGTNIRISNDGGQTWTVLTDVTPAYNSSSMYSFGFEFNEGPGVPGWGGSTNGWQEVTVKIPEEYNGQEVMIRWAFASDPAWSTPDDPSLFGWLVDNINIAGVLQNDGETEEGWTVASQVPVAGDYWHVAFVAELPAPLNLAAEALNGAVHLTWQAPITGNTVNLSYDTGNWRWFLNDAQPYAVVFEVDSNQTVLKSAKFYMYGSPSFSGTIDAFVYSVGPDSMPDQLLWTVQGIDVADYPNPTVVDLQAAGLVFNAGEMFALAVGNFSSASTQGLLAEQDTVTSPPSGHSYVWGGDAWYAINTAYQDVSNLGIRAEVVIPGEGLVPLGYNVYRRTAGTSYDTPLVSNLTALAYTDSSVVNGTEYFYAISAVYSMGESDLSAEASATPESQTVFEMAYDDGTAEAGWNNQGMANTYMAVKFVPPGTHILLKRLRVYVNDTNTGNAIAYVWAADGAGGTPGTELLRTGWSGLQPGWNTKDISGDSVWIETTSFFIGLKRVSSTPSIGVDMSGGYADHSYYDMGQGWGNFQDVGLNYNLMIRADADSAFIVVGIESEPGRLPLTVKLEQNYPNPFNPVTKIRYELPRATHVTLDIYNVKGELVNRVIEGRQTAGSHEITVDGSGLSSGIYIYRLKAEGQVLTRKMLLIK